MAESEYRHGGLSIFAFSLLLISLNLLLAAHSRLETHLAVIAGDSMAPVLRGVHYRLACLRCGFPIECGLAHPPDRMLAFCSNCGFRENPVGPGHLQEADRVQIVPLEIAGPIERWDLIAFRSAGDGSLAVKRVVALPGESPSIERGEVRVDGRLLAKPLRVFRQQAVLVYDGRFRLPAEAGTPRWAAASESRFRYDPQGVATLQGTIAYRHQAISAITTPESSQATQAGLVDLDPYNQSLSRRLFPVSDILLRGEFRFRDPDSHLAVGLGGKTPVILRLDANLDGQASKWHRFELARIDGRLLAAIDGRVTMSTPASSDEQDITLALTISSPKVQLRGLQVWRDIYHLPPNLSGESWSLDRPLRENEYLVLGDNPPASSDSRHWKQGIERRAILGKVYPLHD